MNSRLNGLSANSDMKSIGLPDNATEANKMAHLINNIGAERVGAPGASDTISRLVRSNDIPGSLNIGFVKMDSEVYEMRALTGTRSVFECDKPTKPVDVEDCNDKAVFYLIMRLGCRCERVIRFTSYRASWVLIGSCTSATKFALHSSWRSIHYVQGIRRGPHTASNNAAMGDPTRTVLPKPDRRSIAPRTMPGASDAKRRQASR